MNDFSSQSVKGHIVRTGYEKYHLKFKNTPERSGVIIKGEKPMKLVSIRIAKVRDKNNELEVELISDMNAVE